MVVFAAQSAMRALFRLIGFRPERSLTILYYHGIPWKQVERFERQMHQLSRWARVVSADWDCNPEGEHRHDRNNVAVSFDDAFESVIDNALPVLARYGFPCTIFVPTGYLGQPPTWAMESDTDRSERVVSAERLSRLDRKLVTIGSHSVTHPHMTALPYEAVCRELTDSRRELATITGSEISLFAFPYGDYDTAILGACRSCGYGCAFTIEPTPVILENSAFARGRVGVDPGDGRLEFFLKATGSYSWMRLASTAKRKLREVIACERPH